MWLLAAWILFAVMVVCAVELARGEIMARFAALQLASTIAVLEMLVLAQLLDRDFFFDVALTLALVSFSGSLAFARFLGSWL